MAENPRVKEDAYLGSTEKLLGGAGGASGAALERILANIDRLGLNQNLIELETEGYTMLKGVLSEDQVNRAKAAILKRVEAETGHAIDLETATADDFKNLTYVYYMLYEDEVFEEILMAEKPLALMTYLLGESCLLSSVGSHFKGIGEQGFVRLAFSSECPVFITLGEGIMMFKQERTEFAPLFRWIVVLSTLSSVLVT